MNFLSQKSFNNLKLKAFFLFDIELKFSFLSFENISLEIQNDLQFFIPKFIFFKSILSELQLNKFYYSIFILVNKYL